MTETGPNLPDLHYHRFGGGFKREDVEVALQQLLSTVHSVESNLEELRQKSSQLEQELRDAKAELSAYRVREEKLEAVVRRAEALVARHQPEQSAFADRRPGE